MKIIYAAPESRGWDTVTSMVHLAAELLEADLLLLPAGPVSRVRSLASALPRRKGREACLLVATRPWKLWTVLQGDHFLSRFSQTVAWIIDSFWDNEIPRVATLKHFDHLFITDKELVELWQERTGVPTSWLPVGADVVNIGASNGERTVDLQRYGRQPVTWDNDEATRRACDALSMVFRGRPPFEVGEAVSNQAAIARILQQAKFTLAFSPRSSPADYTHPSRDYLTTRWADALACGTVVAGIPPDCAAADALLWPEATLNLGTTDRNEGLRMVKERLAAWTPATANLNYLRALERFDWRWRFKEIAQQLSRRCSTLDAELSGLRGTLYEAGVLPPSISYE